MRRSIWNSEAYRTNYAVSYKGVFSWPIGCPILNFFWGYLADFCDFTMIFIIIFARGEAGRCASVVDPTETPYMSM